jgi:hypothetical protein
MRPFGTIVAPIVCGSVLFAVPAVACDELIGTIVAKHLAPIIECAGCPGPDEAGMDEPDHKLTGVCYESRGATSHLRIEASLTRSASSESVIAKLGGNATTPSISESVSIDAEIRGSDCSITALDVEPSGEVGKLIAQWFDAEGQARSALEEALDEACNN